MDSEPKIKKILKNRPVLVSGADGFMGSHLTEELLKYKADVFVFIRATSSGSLHNINHLQKKIKILRGDLTDKNAVLQTLKVLKIASKKRGLKPIIFHLGAQAHVGESWQRPYETLNSNVLGTANLLQSIVDLKLELFKLDVAGSSEEYGNIKKEMVKSYRFDRRGGLILDERSPINPQSVYATSKVATDFLTRNYHAAYGIPAIVSRMFNNSGPRQSPRFITGTIISQALKRDFVKLGDVTPKRDFCFVKDGARGHIWATIFGKPGEVYVFGSGKTISILDWYRLIMKIGQKKGYWKKKKLLTHTKGMGRLGKTEVEELRVDFTKLNKLTGWKPIYSWEEGLSLTIDWYTHNKRNWIRKVDWL
jgi:dTDP-glucose 4,6-dehydratase